MSTVHLRDRHNCLRCICFQWRQFWSFFNYDIFYFNTYRAHHNFPLSSHFCHENEIIFKGCVASRVCSAIEGPTKLIAMYILKVNWNCELSFLMEYLISIHIQHITISLFLLVVAKEMILLFPQVFVASRAYSAFEGPTPSVALYTFLTNGSTWLS